MNTWVQVILFPLPLLHIRVSVPYLFLYFGTPEQKQKYIPKLITGEWAGAYGLTEPNSGSDALGAKTTAKLSEDGKYYLLNGQKCWITNGGFADVYTVFAKVDGDKFTGFIVERGTEGFTQGPEEHKMGIKGSSTVQLYFQDCKVPVENLLGEIGKGHMIAFNILNIGRLKLCAAALGGASRALQYFSMNMQRQENNSNNPLPISALSNISWLKWQSRYLLAKPLCIVLQTGLMKKKMNYLQQANHSMKHCWELRKNMRLNVRC